MSWKEMYKCTLCGCESKEKTTHLQLYVIGSEGVEVCLPCRMILTKVAEGLKSTATAVRLTERRKIKVGKEKEHDD